jgi:ribosomal protein L37AE/L43A
MYLLSAGSGGLMYYVLRCPKCYTCRAGSDKNKSWTCFKCRYVMNRKNTKVQAKTISVKETQKVIRMIMDKNAEG